MVDASGAASHSTNDSYEVGHVGLACYLWFKGHGITSKEWSKGLCTWNFASGSELTADVDAFFQGSASVDPREYFAKVTEFKRKMYEDKPQ